MYWLQGVFTRVIREGRRQITILQSLPILNKVLILIFGTIIIPFILTLTFSLLLTLVFAIPGIYLCIRWFSMLITGPGDSDVGDMKIHTFYATEKNRDKVAFIFCMPIVGVVFGGIHCVGWFFEFPSSAEAILWRVSSAVLTGIAFLLPIFLTTFVGFLLRISDSTSHRPRYFAVAVFTPILLVYVVSRLLLLVEAFFSLRQLTPGMLALVKWTSFIPHI